MNKVNGSEKRCAFCKSKIVGYAVPVQFVEGMKYFCNIERCLQEFQQRKRRGR